MPLAIHMPTENGAFFQHANVMVNFAILRGSHVVGHHQDVMLQLTNGTWIRMSRNNGSDTFQIGADPAIGAGMNWLSQMAVLPGTTARTALRAFGDTHAQWPEYHHADCQTFAGDIFNRLTGQGPADDDFM